MLLANYTILNSSPGRAIGGFNNLYQAYKPSSWYSMYDGEDYPRQNAKASFPTGTQPQYSWVLAPKGGEMSATTAIGGGSDLAVNIVQGVGISASLDGTSDLTVSASLITSMIAALAGTSDLTAPLLATLSMAANLAGSGDLAGALGLLVSIDSTLTGSGAMSPNLTGNASMECNIYVNSGTATIQELAAAVWDAQTADHQEAGSTGEALSNAGSAGDPWSTSLPGAYPSGSAGEIIGKNLLTTNKFLALK